MTIVKTDNNELKHLIEILQEQGYFINSVVGDMAHGRNDKEIVMQKEGIQVNIFDLNEIEEV